MFEGGGAGSTGIFAIGLAGGRLTLPFPADFALRFVGMAAAAFATGLDVVGIDLVAVGFDEAGSLVGDFGVGFLLAEAGLATIFLGGTAFFATTTFAVLAVGLLSFRFFVLDAFGAAPLVVSFSGAFVFFCLPKDSLLSGFALVLAFVTTGFAFVPCVFSATALALLVALFGGVVFFFEGFKRNS